MNEQMMIDVFETSTLEDDSIDEVKFQSDNEIEEDIHEVGKLSFSDLAVTGTDWTVETIINQIKKGNIQLDPSFQRRDAWSNKVKSKFIESLFMGLPIPQIILAEQKDKKGKFIVIDGKQRLLSLKQFVLPDEGEAALNLSGLDVLSKFNRMTYADIENGLFFEDIDAFNNQTIRTVVIKNRCKLEYSMNYLVYRGEEEKRINLNEITTLIIQSTQVCITSALLSKLIDSKIKVIFCEQLQMVKNMVFGVIIKMV